MKVLSPHAFIRSAAGMPVVDVRSPQEYRQGHIPGAVNIPLFDDEGRKMVGTLYKQAGREQAIDKGLELVGPKAVDMLNEARKMAAGKALAVYCWRGGMRSRNMALLFSMGGLSCSLLEGGYKAYRAYGRELLAQVSRCIVLAGPTGSGKTDILHELAALGEQVIDLEGLAHHKGSVFGGYNQAEQPTTEHFHNLITDRLGQFDPGKRIWLESESLTIGNVNLPQDLWAGMNAGAVIELDMEPELRLGRLWNEYGDMPEKDVIECIRRITDQLGGQHAKRALEMLGEGERQPVAEMLLDYYDKRYAHSRARHRTGPVHSLPCRESDPAVNARLVLQMANTLGL